MTKLESPVRRYTTGKLPTHSSTASLHTHFKQMPKEALTTALQANGYLSDSGKPTKKALTDDLLDVCDKAVIWRLSQVGKLLESAGMNVKRQYGNQSIDPPTSSDPTWVNLTTISTFFNVTPGTIGKWLDALELREDDGLPTKDAQDRGLGTVSEMSAGKKKTRKIAMWESYLVRVMLRDNGHPLDFDYAKSLEAKGKNSAVKVETMDSRALEFAKEFAALYKTRSRSSCSSLVKKTPKPILKRAEVLLKKPSGWLENGAYLERLR